MSFINFQREPYAQITLVDPVSNHDKMGEEAFH